MVPSKVFKTEISYTLDGGNITAHTMDSNAMHSPAIQYNTDLISLVNLTETQHNLTIFIGGSRNGTPDKRQSALGAIFDYAMYTTT